MSTFSFNSLRSSMFRGVIGLRPWEDSRQEYRKRIKMVRCMWCVQWSNDWMTHYLIDHLPRLPSADVLEVNHFQSICLPPERRPTSRIPAQWTKRYTSTFHCSPCCGMTPAAQIADLPASQAPQYLKKKSHHFTTDHIIHSATHVSHSALSLSPPN